MGEIYESWKLYVNTHLTSLWDLLKHALSLKKKTKKEGTWTLLYHEMWEQGTWTLCSTLKSESKVHELYSNFNIQVRNLKYLDLYGCLNWNMRGPHGVLIVQDAHPSLTPKAI